MGAGKTTTGRRLARILQLRFIDLDEEIARRHGPIPAIFETEGEAVFRRYESVVLGEISTQGPLVLAVGGGAVLNDENRKRMREHGVIVHLSVTPSTALRRVARRKHRPLLGDRPDLVRIQSLLAARADAYADNDLAIRVDTKSPLTTARFIARWYLDMQKIAAT